MQLNVLGAPVKVTKGKPTKVKTKPLTPIKTPFPDLIDPTKRTALARKFEPFFETFFAAPKTSGLMAAAVTTFFNDQRVYHISQEARIGKNLKDPAKAYLEMAESYSKRAVGNGTFDHKMRITDNNVVLYTRPIELDFMMTLPGPQDNAERQSLTAYMKTLFPAFALPVAWQYTATDTPPIKFIMGNTEITTGWKNIDAFQSQIQLNDVTNNSFVPQINFKETVASDMSQAAYASLFGIITLNSLGYFDKYTMGIEGNAPATGPLQVPILQALAKVTIQTQIRIPLEMALWMTLQTHPDQFSPKTFHDFASEHLAALTGFSKENPKNIPKQTMTLKDIHESNVSRMKEFGMVLKPRVNEDDFMVNSNGNIWHVPTINETATYDAIQRKAYDPTTGTIIPDHKIPELKNKVIYTDLVNEVFSYTNSDGKLQYERLSGGIPLDKVTIAKHLKRAPGDLFGVTDPNKTEYEANASNVSENFFSLIQALIEEGNKDGLTLMQPNPADYGSIRSVWDYICTFGAKYDVADVFTLKAEGTPILKGMTQSFITTMKNVLGYLPRQTRYGVSTLIDIRFWLVFFTKYATNPTPYIVHLNESIQKNTPVSVTELPDSIDIPNLAPGRAVLPHQLQAVQQAERGPQLLILDFSPGGGKTGTSIFDIIIQKMAGRVGTSVVICPPVLVKEWCSEIVKFTGGKMNAIPLTSKVIRKLRGKMKITREQFLDYCVKAPPNTIFVTSMKFLTLRSDKFAPDNKSRFDVRYGKTIISQYPQVWFIKQLNPEYIVVDESQWAKSSNAQVTQAIKQIASVANFRRLSSGTLVTNQGDDLIGQASILNPAIYGDKNKFFDRYAITKGRSGKKFDGFKPGAERLIRDDAKPYVAWLTKRRADWSFLLPEIHTQFWRCHLTDNQKQFYEDLLEAAIEEIKKDKEIKKLLAENDPNLEDQLEAMMRPYLAKVEIFINAPDSDRLAFNTLSYAEPEDMVSPKVTLCEKICKAHFGGGTVGGEPVAKSDAKIIIFGYNIETIEHFKRHFNPGFKTVFYQSGDEDAVLKFRNDNTIKIMVAAETSLREGLNLQVADTLIRLQTLWSPGNQEQAVSRVMRPDVGNQYNRSEINYYWLVTDNTMEVAKTCRLVSKIMSNLTITEGENPEFQEFSKKFDLTELPLIKMNILKEDSPVRYMNWDFMPQYAAAWNNFLVYEEQQFVSRKAELRRMVAKRLNIPVEQVTDDIAKKNAFTPVVSTKMIPGSKSVWIPLERGAVPHDPFDLDLKAVAVLQKDEAKADGDDDNSADEDDDEEDDDNATIVEQQPIKEGDLVYTEFGMGYARKIRDKSVVVDLPGVPFSPLSLNKTLVYKPQNAVNEAKVLKMMKLQGSKGISFMNGFGHIPSLISNPNLKINNQKQSIQTQPQPNKARSQQAEPVVMPDDNDRGKRVQPNKDILPNSRTRLYPVQVEAGIFDGFPCVYFLSDQEHLKKVWNKIPVTIGGTYPQFVYRHVRTWQGLKNLINQLEANYNIIPGTTEQLLNAGKKLYHRGTPQLIQRDPITLDFKRFLYITSHKPNKNPDTLKVYPMIMNGQLYVVAPTMNQPKAASNFKKLVVSGVGPAQIQEPMHLLYFRNPKRAIRYLTELAKHFNLAGYDEAIHLLRSTPPAFYKL